MAKICTLSITCVSGRHVKPQEYGVDEEDGF